MRHKPTQLYRHFDDEGNLLYVGISLSAIYRLKQHRNSHWSDKIARVDITHYQSRAEAMRAEILAIESEMPLYNIVRSTMPQDARQIPRLKFDISDSDLSRLAIDNQVQAEKYQRDLWLNTLNDDEYEEYMLKNARQLKKQKTKDFKINQLSGGNEN